MRPAPRAWAVGAEVEVGVEVKADLPETVEAAAEALVVTVGAQEVAAVAEGVVEAQLCSFAHLFCYSRIFTRFASQITTWHRNTILLDSVQYNPQ